MNVEHAVLKITKTLPEHNRKRAVQKEKQKRNVAKQLRYSPGELPKYPSCKHKSGKIKCKSLSMADIKFFHGLFYKEKDKIKQDTITYKYCCASKPKRSRLRNNTRGKKGLTIIYNSFTKSKELVRVCRETFLGVFNLKKDRVQLVLRNYNLIDRGPPVEKRGGDRIGSKNDNKKQAISQFIENVQCTQSHYCTSRIIARVYLNCELNMRKLYKLYNNSTEQHLQVKESYFRNYVNRNYNIGFGTPQKDVCSVCCQFKENVKRETDSKVKNEMLIKQRVHKLKANTFYRLLKETNDHVCSISFDCQKNVALPHLPDSSAYFSQQYNLYNFTVVRGSSQSNLMSSKCNVIFMDRCGSS